MTHLKPAHARHRQTRMALALALALSPQLALAQSPADLSSATSAGIGTLSGRIKGAGIGVPAGLRVELEGASLSTRADAEGRFRFEGLHPGRYTVVVADERFAEARASVSVQAGTTTDAALVLNAKSAATQLDKVVVRGISGAATLRSVSSPISIMTADDIEKKQALNLTDLLRGQLPGMSLSAAGQNDWSTLVNARGDTSWNDTGSETNGDYMKILIDDVEIVRPTLLSLIDPKSIEQIEIVRGPLAGAMYGAEGSSGVMRITTKKGRAGQAPEFTAQLAAGVIESDAKAKGVTPTVIDKSMQVLGGSETTSYRLGVSEVDIGAWAPAYDSKSRMVSGAIQTMQGPFDVSVSAIHSDRNLVLSKYPSCVGKPTGGECSGGMDYPMSETLFATTINYEATPDWHHTLTFGYDQNKFGYEGLSFGDFRAKSSDYERRTFRYFTNYEKRLSDNITGRFTLGSDLVLYNWQEAEGGTIYEEPDAEDGHSHNNVIGWRNLGYYGVAEFGFHDRLYLTLAGRKEQRLRRVSPEHDSPFQPRAGLSYVFGGDNGGTTVKARAQWGTSARAPATDPFKALTGWMQTIPAVNLRPEEKVGWDAGFDIVWPRLGSLSITRFDEKGRDLVMPVLLNPGAPNRQRRYQYQNFGEVSNKGWELEARMVMGPLGLRANFTKADNFIEKISDSANGEVGERRPNVPRYAGGLTATVNAFRGTISLDGTFIGPTRRPFQPVGYTADNWYRVNLRTEQAITDNLTLFARVDNILNDQESETYAFQVTPGRTTVLGLRYTFSADDLSPRPTPAPLVPAVAPDSQVAGTIVSSERSEPSPIVSAAEPTYSAPGMTDVAATSIHAPVHSFDAVRVVGVRQSINDITSPVSVINQDELLERGAGTLGEALRHLPGVQSDTFGGGTSRPVIRGQTAPRVKVLSDSSAVVDASDISPDHAITADPLLGERIEVLRGPATLLYGGGAIGGVVNVLDNKIPGSRPNDGMEGRLFLRGNTAGNENAYGGAVSKQIGSNLVLHAEGSHREADDYRAPTIGRSYVNSTFSESTNGSLGFSWVTDKGYVGLAYSERHDEYGLPGHSHKYEACRPNVSMLDCGTLGEDDAPPADDGHNHNTEFAYGHDATVDLKSKRWDLRGEYRDPFAFISDVRFRASHTDYRHNELDVGEVVTTFTNKGDDARVEFQHQEIGAWSGVFGLQHADTTFSAEGVEAFLPTVKTQSTGLFVLEHFEPSDAWRFELGARQDWLKHTPTDDASNRTFDSNAFSYSGAATWSFADSHSLTLSAARSQRLPHVQELYARGVHLATNTYECGLLPDALTCGGAGNDADLARETSQNVELTLRGEEGPFSYRVDAYVNKVDDYVYARTLDRFDAFRLIKYTQADAKFRGFEAEASWRFSDTLSATVFGDRVRATLADGGGNLPRIAPERVGARINLDMGTFNSEIEYTRVSAQDKIADFETRTPGYGLLGMSVGYTLPDGRSRFFLRGDNLLDRLVWNHTSFLSDVVPQPGRNFTAGYSYTF